mmetsp:Transcript_3389/g.6339  ORF Transcript_3389/g.6339 Transcript_3389/m.6339 type:complete len:97 (-) Transcript_3389:2633-2923(-)
MHRQGGCKEIKADDDLVRVFNEDRRSKHEAPCLGIQDECDALMNRAFKLLHCSFVHFYHVDVRGLSLISKSQYDVTTTTHATFTLDIGNFSHDYFL